MNKRNIMNLLAVASLFAMSTSCKKSSEPTTTYSFTAKFDGTEKTFSVLTNAVKNYSNGMYYMNLIGIGATESISMNLVSTQDDFTAGKTFTADASGPGGNSLAYGPNGVSDSTQSYYSFYLYSPPLPENFTCTITGTTPTSIQGTFSGTLYRNEPGVTEKIEVTEGTFNSKL